MPAADADAVDAAFVDVDEDCVPADNVLLAAVAVADADAGAGAPVAAAPAVIVTGT